MMKTLRKNYKKIMIGLAILIIPAFVWWGAGTSSDGGTISGGAGFIGGTKVTLNEYRAVYADLNRSMTQLFGSPPPESLLREMTWTRLLLIHEAQMEGIKVTDQEIREQIQRFPHFQKDDAFDPASYQRAFGDQARTFEESMRQEMLLDKLRAEVTSGIQITEEEIRNEYVRQKEKQETEWNEDLFQSEKPDFEQAFLEKKKSDVYNQWISDLRQKTPVKSALEER